MRALSTFVAQRAGGSPAEMFRVLSAKDRAAREEAWTGFVETYSWLLIRVTRSLGGGYDAAMDAYAFVLEQLHGDDFRRLRAYATNGGSRFSTWLVVVARRLSIDHYRRRYGRARGTRADERAARAARRRLVDLVADDVDAASLSEPAASTPDGELQAQECRAALRSVLADLPARDRLLLALRFDDDVPVRDIARAMGFPTPFHVYRRLNALLQGLRRSLAQRGVEEAGP